MAFPCKSTPKPPYYAAIFTSTRHPTPDDGYKEMSELMGELAAKQPGYLGIEHTHNPGSVMGEVHSITVAYWKDEESIRAWKRHVEHRAAQKRGKEEWYLGYELRIAKVERAYGWERKNSEGVGEVEGGSVGGD